MKITFAKLVFSLVLFLSPFIALAGTEHNMTGWAWSSNIGWISFNSTNCDTDRNGFTDFSCGGANKGSSSLVKNYGVNKNEDGTLAGYAWSSNIGWIKFGGLSGFPSGTGTQAINAKVTGSKLEGWAKALSADGNGWDGWISLSGKTTAGADYGVSFNSTDGGFGSYAWGSDVVGWVNFSVDGPGGGVNPDIRVVCSSCGTSQRPVVVSSVYNNVTASTATLGATIQNLGIPDATSRGIVYSEYSSTPTLSNAEIVPVLGVDLDPYSIIVTDLKPNTTYYFAGYATNTVGTGYSTPVSFTTDSSGLINASCGAVPVHYVCSAGINPQGNNPGGTNVENEAGYTWKCDGINGGTNTTCSETKGAGPTGPRRPRFEED